LPERRIDRLSGAAPPIPAAVDSPRNGTIPLAGGTVISRLPVNSITRFLTVVTAVLLIGGCAAGAPSVNREPATESSGGNAIDAPSQAVVPVSTGTPEQSQTINTGGQPSSSENDALPGVAALQATGETPTPEPTPTIEPTREPTPTPEPSETPRPEAPVPSDPGMSEVYESGAGERDEIALTFDAGDDRGYAEEILDTLKEYDVLATFGITGQWASDNPDLVKRMVDEGHQVINHTWSHDSFTGGSTGEGTGITDRDAREEELASTNDAIGGATGGYDTRPYFRPPYGDLDETVLADVASFGYTVTVMWSCDSLGWNGLTADEINERCTDPAQAGDIILMHVGAASQDAAALPKMIEQLQANGFQLVTVEQMLQP
jgi:peptidoglycan/xylan/chitin deacetylase (PgdA/CDA1 family)